MKILKLTAENFKKLSAVEITPDGNVVMITGKNEAGKSSVLDAIEVALCGGRMPKKPIKDGEVRGKVEVDMGEYKVTRKFFGATSTLTVETTGETKSKISSPQAFLDKIVGSLSFDPLAFLKKTPADQRNTLMDFLGLNLQEFEDKILSIKAQRSEVRRDKERALHKAESITTTPNVPPQEISSDSLLAELKAIQLHNEECQKIATENAVNYQKQQAVLEDISAAKKAIEDWKKRLTALEAQERDLAKLLHRESETSAIKKNSAEVEAKLKSLEATNAAIRKNAQKKEAIAEADKCTEEYRRLGDEIKIVENQKAKKLAETPMPVKGLSILTDGLAFNGIPLEQECDSMKLKICVAIAMALNPKLKVLRINGNEFDNDSLKVIGELVAEKDYQIWIEKVADDNTIGFYIEDGYLGR